MKRFLLAQVWAFFLTLPQLALFTHASNRYLLFWDRWSAPLHLGCVVLLGVVIWPFFRWRWTTPLLAGLMIAGEARGLAELSSGWPRYALLGSLALGLPCAILAARRWDFPRIAERATFFVAPLVPIYWLNLFLAPTFDGPRVVEATDPKQTPPTGDTFVVILDAWSYRLTFDGMDVTLPRIRELAARSCVFTDAHAPGCHTINSLPRFLFQRDDSFAIEGSTLGFWDGQRFRPCDELETIFDRAGAMGHRTAMIGWYHQYPRMLGGRIDLGFSSNGFRWLGDEPLDVARQFYHEAARKLLERSVIREAARPLHTLNLKLVRQTDEVMRNVRRVIAEPRAVFAVFHLPLPHYPFCYGAEGLLDVRAEYPTGSEHLAREQHLYTDRLVGEILDRLRELGRFDNATIVLTSDHTWRNDPQLQPGSRAWSHVPCIVKLPGQTAPRRIDQPFTTSRLVRFLERGEVLHVPIDDAEADLGKVKPIIR